jgi:hypothetical protein
MQIRVNKTGLIFTSIGGVLEISDWAMFEGDIVTSDGVSGCFYGSCSQTLVRRELNLLDSAASWTIG